MGKLRNTHNRYTRWRNDGIMYRGPMGVCTCTTPAASLSINILGPSVSEVLARAILGPPLLHRRGCKGSFFSLLGESWVVRERRCSFGRMDPSLNRRSESAQNP